jgi:hypothetical protein
MSDKNLTETKEFQELLAMIPEGERAKVLEGIENLRREFTEKVLKPIESAVNTQKPKSE